MGMAARISAPQPRVCAGKVRYRTLAKAQEACVRLAEAVAQGLAKPAYNHRPLNVYSCPCCAFWHVGHKPSQ